MSRRFLLADADDLRGEIANVFRAFASRMLPGGREIALAILESRGRLVSLRIAHPGETGRKNLGTCVVELSAYPAGQPLLDSSCRFRLKLSGGDVTVFNWTRRGRQLSLPGAAARESDPYSLAMLLPQAAENELIALTARIVSPQTRYPRALKIYLEPMTADERQLVDVAIESDGTDGPAGPGGTLR